MIDARNFAPDVIVYKAEDGKEYPAFCANPNKGGVENFAAKNYDVDVDRLDKDPHVWGAITNGYPYKTPAELGVKMLMRHITSQKWRFGQSSMIITAI